MSTAANIDRRTIRLFWQTAIRYRGLLLRALFFPLGTIFMGVVAPLNLSKALGALALPDGQPLHYLLLFVLAAGTGLVCNRIGHPALMRHQVYVMRDLQRQALDTLLRRSVGFHNNNVGGKLVSDALDYANAYSRVADSFATGLVPLSTTLVVGSSIVYTQSWPLGLFITFVTVLIMGLGVYDTYRMGPHRKRRQIASKAVTAHMADTITNIQTAKIFSREPDELKRHDHLNAKMTELRMHDWLLMSRRGNNRMILLVTLQALLVFVVIRLVQANPALLGTGIFAFAFTVTLSNRLFDVNLQIRNLEEGLLDASPMAAIIGETPEIVDRRGAKALVVQGGAVAFERVTFAYSDAHQQEAVFEGLQLEIAPGEKVGLVGPSGGGKSTLTRLLLRFDDINDGAIRIDEQDIAAVTQASLRRAISYVPQEPLLFHRSVGENIAYGKPEANEAAIRRAAAQAHADEFIEKLPGGYDTVVGERGVKLSGGQRQRVAIARAILKDAPILILDEATSALDSESEVLIQDALWKLMEGRTTIVVAHRLSTIQHMDRIVVLDNGRIVEQGSHAELLAHGGLYAKLWSHQSGGFIEE